MQEEAGIDCGGTCGFPNPRCEIWFVDGSGEKLGRLAQSFGLTRASFDGLVGRVHADSLMPVGRKEKRVSAIPTAKIQNSTRRPKFTCYEYGKL